MQLELAQLQEAGLPVQERLEPVQVEQLEQEKPLPREPLVRLEPLESESQEVRLEPLESESQEVPQGLEV